MAELGLLRHVEVISCVSGGSIVGAAYYLKVKSLLERTPEGSITDEHYITAVAELQRHFIVAIQKNLRMRTFANPWRNARMARRDFSRSDAIGLLYEEEIYRALLDAREFSSRRILMEDLLIRPADVPEGFHPFQGSHCNRLRHRAKVPILVLNATSLNSGHNWVFTAKSMGESPPRSKAFARVDKNDRYRRVRYEEVDANARRRGFPLGAAVGASAAVPGLFPPLAVSNLYENHRIQLVDGGVYDNQGIASLQDPDHPCERFVVSDASGPSESHANPKADGVSVLLGTTSILMARVREEVVSHLLEPGEPGEPDATLARSDESSPRICYIDLMRGIGAQQHDARGQERAERRVHRQMEDGELSCEKDYGVHEDFQKALARIRTDLDSFTDIEAHALQADAYLMSEKPLRRLAAQYDCHDAGPCNWDFSEMAERLTSGETNTTDPVLIHLEVGRHQFLKAWLLAYRLGLAHTLPLLVLSVFLVVVLGGYVWGAASLLDWWLQPFGIADVFRLREAAVARALVLVLPPVGAALLNIALAAIADRLLAGSGRYVSLARRALHLPQEVLSLALRFIVFPVAISLPVCIYLLTIDRYYLRMGRIGPPNTGSIRPSGRAPAAAQEAAAGA